MSKHQAVGCLSPLCSVVRLEVVVSSFTFFKIFSPLQLLQMKPEQVLIESTGVIGHRIKKVNEDLHVSLFYVRCW